jgi:hypothetical protein
MQLLMFYTPSATRPAAPPSEECMDEMNRLIDVSLKSGQMIATGGLTPLKDGARVAQATGKVTVTDGPFIESTEIIGGFALFELPSLEAAIESSKNFLKIAGDGHVTIRPLMDPSQTGTGTCTGADAVAMHAGR